MDSSAFAPHMRHAATLALQGRAYVYPNPTVGAVLVRDNVIVAEGWHKEYGGPHAEVECLNDAKAKNIDPSTCTLVVTLEPCHHHGKTPPCTQAILEAGIKHVVFGLRDPNEIASGGAAYLASQGVKVEEGVEALLCRDILADFLCWREKKRPYVLLKLASTLDGRIATRTGQSQWVSGEDSRHRVQIMRKKIARVGGAIMIGGGTFREDNPRLTVRYPEGEEGPQPLACIVTSRLPVVSLDNTILQTRPKDAIFFSTPAGAASPTAKALIDMGARVWSQAPQSGAIRLPQLDILLGRLFSELQCPYVLCEGGGKLALSLLELGLVDEFHLHLAPCILGDNEARPLFDGKSPTNMSEALSMRISDYEMHGEDIHLVLRPK